MYNREEVRKTFRYSWFSVRWRARYFRKLVIMNLAKSLKLK